MGNQPSKKSNNSTIKSTSSPVKLNSTWKSSAGWNHPAQFSPETPINSAQLYKTKERAPDDKMTDHDYLEGVVAYGSSAMQGKRQYMEDVHVACLSLPHPQPQVEMRSRRKSLLDMFRSSASEPVVGEEAPRRKSVWQSVSDVFSGSSDDNREAAARAAAITQPEGFTGGGRSSVRPQDSTPQDLSPPPQNRRKSVLERLGLVSSEPVMATPSNVPKTYSYFSVIDGHAGVAVAEKTADRLHYVLAQQPEFLQGNYKEAMIKGYLAMDEELKKDQVCIASKSGACVTTAVLVGRHLIVANVGDARGVIVTKGGVCIRATVDHEPESPIELARITAAGGTVDYDGRVGGYIAVSRTLGDFIGKQHPRLSPAQQMISDVPDVYERDLEDDDEFLIMASDGIWTIFDSDQSVINFIRIRLYRGLSLAKCCEELLDTIYMLTQGTSRCDNKTVMIVAFLNGKQTEQAWVEQNYMAPNGRLGNLPEGYSWDAKQGVAGAEGLLTVQLVQKKGSIMASRSTKKYSTDGLKGTKGGVRTGGDPGSPTASEPPSNMVMSPASLSPSPATTSVPTLKEMN